MPGLHPDQAPVMPLEAEFGPAQESFQVFLSPVLQGRWEQAQQNAQPGYDAVASDLAQFGFNIDEFGTALQVFGAFHHDAGDSGRRQEAYNEIVQLVEAGRAANAPGVYGPVLPPEMVADAVAKRFGYEGGVNEMGDAANRMFMMQQDILRRRFFEEDDDKDDDGTSSKSGSKSSTKKSTAKTPVVPSPLWGFTLHF